MPVARIIISFGADSETAAALEEYRAAMQKTMPFGVVISEAALARSLMLMGLEAFKQVQRRKGPSTAPQSGDKEKKP